MKKSILYIQFTNPAAYPSLEHSSRLLAEKGWTVEFLGTGAFGAGSMQFAAHDNIRVRQLAFSRAGLGQKFHYLRYCLWVLFSALTGRPDWIYVSDPLSCPPALFLNYFFRQRVIYHEHDSPGPQKNKTLFMKLVLSARVKLAKRAKLSVLPNEMRVKNFSREMGGLNNVVCVWNCPSLDEVDRGILKKSDEETRLFYHGSITPVRLPVTVLEAMVLLPKRIKLCVVGYQTIGSPDYVEKLKQKAASLGIHDRLEVIGVVPSRQELLGLCRLSHVGLAFMPKTTDDVNEKTMTGASNKPFEYLACGLALLVSDLPDWKKMFTETGYGLACDIEDPRSIADAIGWFLEHPAELRRMSAAGREKILEEWNYENQFQPVLKVLEA